MADDSELEKRAIEELLRETNRARVRAETMGPAGWMKCPLRSTNKRFLLNTLRSTGLQCRTTTGQSTARGRLRSESQSQDRSRSRTPPRDHRANGGHRDHKHHRDSSNNDDTRHNRDKDKSYRQKDIASRDQRHRKDGHNRDSETHYKNLSPGEGHSSSRGHSLSREYCHSQHRLGSSCNCSLTTRHAPQSCWKFDRSCSRSPVGDVYSKRSQK